MRAFISILLLGLGSMASAGTFRFQPCTYWHYDVSANAYVCSFMGPYIDVVTASDKDELTRTIEAQKLKIAELEERLEKLEQEITP